MIEVDKKWLGLPMDETNCWQFIVDYYREELGIFLWPFEGQLSGRKDRERLASFLESYFGNEEYWIKIKDPVYPDIAMFEVKELMVHGTIILDQSRMLHMRASGSLITSYKDGIYFRERKFTSLRGFYRYRKGSS